MLVPTSRQVVCGGRACSPQPQETANAHLHTHPHTPLWGLGVGVYTTQKNLTHTHTHTKKKLRGVHAHPRAFGEIVPPTELETQNQETVACVSNPSRTTSYFHQGLLLQESNLMCSVSPQDSEKLKTLLYHLGKKQNKTKQKKKKKTWKTLHHTAQ